MKTAFLVCASVLLCAGTAGAGMVFAPSYGETISFGSGVPSTTMPLAYDGTYYWSTSGGGSSGARLAQHNGTTGAIITTYSPGLDFRSIWMGSDGEVYARSYANGAIYEMTSPGVFTPSGVTLTGGYLDAQSAVVTYGPAGEYIAKSGSLVTRWDASGSYIGDVTLSGFGSVADEGAYPQQINFAVMGDYWLTYSNGILSAWDQAGNRVDQTTLLGAGTSFDSHFSFSYTNGMAFVNDDAGSLWRGYALTPAVAAVPAPAAVMLGAMGMSLVGWLRRRNTL